METKLTHMLSIISGKLSQKQIPFCLIGAMALGVYGLPRFTSDIDLLSEAGQWPEILPIMQKLGYECCQKTDHFAQFDSELGVYGKVDFMLVSTQDGRDILGRSVRIREEIFGNIPVIQPSDYVILKLMAIANNPDRSAKDESDLSVLFALHKNHLLADCFEPLDLNLILMFADRFGQRKLVEKYLKDAAHAPGGPHRL
jgi:hypothetical protein